MRRLSLSVLAAVLLAAVAVVLGPLTTAASASTQLQPGLFPTDIALPDGFQPEGLAIHGAFAFSGSLVDGSIARLNLVNGRVSVLAPGPGAASAGMKVDDRGRLFVAGGPSGEGRVVDTATGAVLATYHLAPAGGFVNDVVLTPDAAFFTDSVNPVLYKLPLGRGGSLPARSQVVTVPLTGDFVTGAGFNANGISRTPDGRALIVVQTNTGLLFRVDPATGVARTIDLGGELVTNGDGIFLSGRSLFVVQNQNNLVAKVQLDPTGRHGRVLSRTTDPRFDVPTAAGVFGDRLYLVNARFDVAPTADTTYSVVAIERP